MKTTLNLPDNLAHAAKAKAAANGQSLPEFLLSVVASEVKPARKQATGKTWMKLAGALREYPKELDLADNVVEEAFERVDPRDWK